MVLSILETMCGFFLNSLSLSLSLPLPSRLVVLVSSRQLCMKNSLTVYLASYQYLLQRYILLYIHVLIQLLYMYVHVCVSFRIIIVLFHLQQDGMYAGKK